MFHRLVIAFAGWLITAQMASAEMDPDIARWGQPRDRVAEEDDPAAPFVAYFTPAYQDETGIATWSMMAARWRGSDRVDISVGIRLAHSDNAPWNIAFARFGDGPLLPIETLEPIRTCGTDGICVQRETAAIALPPAALRSGAINGLSITIVTAKGADHRIAFPRDILDELHARSGLGQLP